MKSRYNLPVLAVSNPVSVPAGQIIEATIPGEASSPGLSLSQILSILRAYLAQILIIIAVFSIGMAGVIKLMPKTYLATTTLMVNPEGTDPLAANPQAVTIPIFNIMSTESQLMLSAEVLLPVIDKLHLADNKTYSGGYKGNNLRDWVRENLVKSLDIQLGAFGSHLISINASARDPQLAADIANTLAEVYLSEQRQRVSGPASERAQRYKTELGELKDKVRIAQDQVTAFRQRTGVTDTSGRSNVEQALLASLEGKLQDAQNARRNAEVRAASDRENSSAAAASTTVQNLRALLNTQQAQLAQLRTTYGSEHPKLREIENQLHATQANLDRELRSVNSVNSSDLDAARQLEAKTRAAVEEQRNKVLSVNKLQDDGMKYELELESAQSVYKRALDGYDQIMFASGSHAENITIVSRAVAPPRAAKPNKIKLLAMGILAGIGIGVLAPLLYELLINRRIRCRDDYERNFDLPVLMEFERIDAVRGM